MFPGVDLLVALVSLPGKTGPGPEEVRGITRLEKLVFLALEEAGFKDVVDTDYDYQAYDFGPYSTKVVQELEALKAMGVISVRAIPLGSINEIVDREAVRLAVGDEPTHERTVEVLAISERGLRVWNEIVRKKIAQARWMRLQELKERYNSTDLESLLRYVYSTYPEFTVKSWIAKQLFGMGRRPQLKAFDREEQA